MTFRLENLEFINNKSIWISILIACTVAIVSYHVFGLYRTLVRFLTGKVLIIVGKGAVAASIALYAAGMALDAGLPRSVPIIFGILMLLSVGSIRFAVRKLLRNPGELRKRPAIIYGAGDSGLQLLNSLYHGKDYAPIALVDDNPQLLKLSVGGLRVHAPGEIPKIVQSTGASIVLLAIPSISRERRREIVNNLEYFDIEIKTVPEMSEIISGRAKISEIRSVTPEDLLGRDLVSPDPNLLGKTIADRIVMVTGAGGSIGSELCRQILIQNPKSLLIFDVSEFSLYTIHDELSATVDRLGLNTKIIPLLGSIQLERRLENAIESFGVQTIYHAAAYKHVPLVEDNVIEGVLNNVFGTLAIVSVAAKLGVENFILISTDKAVRPTNVMGATKRVAELICQAYAQESSSTVFSMVRFGNVLGSSGSVIPKFRAQIEKGEPVTVTHKEITRYFMTIPEAAQLVIQAGAMAKGGDVFVLDMGEPVKILDVAIGMIRLFGLKHYFIEQSDQPLRREGHIPIRISGLRKGEKLYEELLIGNKASPTQHPRIMTASEISLPMETLTSSLMQLRRACDCGDLTSIIEILREMPLDYSPEGKVM